MNERTKDKAVVAEEPGTVRTRAELDAALEAGFSSDRTEETIPETAERALRQLKNG